MYAIHTFDICNSVPSSKEYTPYSFMALCDYLRAETPLITFKADVLRSLVQSKISVSGWVVVSFSNSLYSLEGL